MNHSRGGNPPLGWTWFSAYARGVESGEILRNGASASALAVCKTRSSLRILLADDEMLIRKLCTRVLRDFGYQTETANDGAAAWKALQGNVYDLLITDNNMPKVSGVELVKKVRSANMTLPVILISGNLPTGELDRNPCLQDVATLAKPFAGEELLGTVERVLRENAMTREQTESLPIFSQ
jgi:DNA-binding response OmpR family regulator